MVYGTDERALLLVSNDNIKHTCQHRLTKGSPQRDEIICNKSNQIVKNSADVSCTMFIDQLIPATIVAIIGPYMLIQFTYDCGVTRPHCVRVHAFCHCCIFELEQICGHLNVTYTGSAICKSLVSRNTKVINIRRHFVQCPRLHVSEMKRKTNE
jgi:hypothetical protein